MSGLIRTSAAHASMVSLLAPNPEPDRMAELDALIAAGLGDVQAMQKRWRKPPAVKHGTLHAYKNLRCRCGPCAELYLEFLRERRERGRR